MKKHSKKILTSLAILSSMTIFAVVGNANESTYGQLMADANLGNIESAKGVQEFAYLKSKQEIIPFLELEMKQKEEDKKREEERLKKIEQAKLKKIEEEKKRLKEEAKAKAEGPKPKGEAPGAPGAPGGQGGLPRPEGPRPQGGAPGVPGGQGGGQRQEGQPQPRKFEQRPTKR